jgi:hypothetical protein
MPLVLTNLGLMYPCGHERARPVVDAPLSGQHPYDASRPTARQHQPPAFETDAGQMKENRARLYPDVGQEVTVTYGRELFAPVQYNNFECGPYSATSTIREGETRMGAMKRVLKDLEEFASSERQRKADAWLAAYKGIVGRAASR